ncbi:hypothetical protein NEOLEDRAFT_1151270 [Neolentinus lepideus HHB14362 ss-1]|uniref:Transmembrane protein n=1 Tax=Neolentinus lepideus HHB14362 ss-1 TaxID=1314782 RepID=A0A165P6Q9_9AGAM|nr:hypothetical protein NEOLEDRAFT_1151270 [Neolentinus lepideus HHB14362 ss-1]
MYASTATANIAANNSSAPQEPEGVNTGVAIFMGFLFMILVIASLAKYWATCFPSYDTEPRQMARAPCVYRAKVVPKTEVLFVEEKSYETGTRMKKLFSMFNRIVRKVPSQSAAKNEVSEAQEEGRQTWKERQSMVRTWLAQRNVSVRWFFAGVGNSVLRVLRIRPSIALTSPSGAILPLPSTVMDVGHNMVSEIAPQDPRRLTVISWIDWLWVHQEKVDERMEAEMESDKETDNHADVEAQTHSAGSFLAPFNFVSHWVIDAANIAASARRSVFGGDAVPPVSGLSTIAEEEEDDVPTMPGALSDSSTTASDDDKTRIADHSFLEEEDITMELTVADALALAEAGQSFSVKDEKKVLPSAPSIDLTDLQLHHSGPDSFAPGTPLQSDAVRFTPRPRELPQVKAEKETKRPIIPHIFVGRYNLYTPRRSSPAVRMPGQEDWI